MVKITDILILWLLELTVQLLIQCDNMHASGSLKLKCKRNSILYTKQLVFTKLLNYDGV